MLESVGCIQIKKKEKEIAGNQSCSSKTEQSDKKVATIMVQYTGKTHTHGTRNNQVSIDYELVQSIVRYQVYPSFVIRPRLLVLER